MFHVFPQAVSKKECEKLLEYCIKNTNFREASMLNIGKTDVDADNFGRVDPRIRKTDIAFVTPDGNEDNSVNEIAWHFLTMANEIKFNYKLDYFQPVQFARYRNGGHYDWHQDASGQNPHGEARKLSLTFSLSDPQTYEGGHLEFYRGERPMDEQVIEDIRGQGSGVVFDSRDYHRVTRNKRHTLFDCLLDSRT